MEDSGPVLPVLSVLYSCVLYFHIFTRVCPQASGCRMCWERKVQSTQWICCPNLLRCCRFLSCDHVQGGKKNGDGEAFTHPLLGPNMLQLSVWFRMSINPITSSIADSQGIDQQSFLARRTGCNLGNGSISFLWLQMRWICLLCVRVDASACGVLWEEGECGFVFNSESSRRLDTPIFAKRNIRIKALAKARHVPVQVCTNWKESTHFTSYFRSRSVILADLEMPGRLLLMKAPSWPNRSVRFIRVDP